MTSELFFNPQRHEAQEFNEVEPLTSSGVVCIYRKSYLSQKNLN